MVHLCISSAQGDGNVECIREQVAVKGETIQLGIGVCGLVEQKPRTHKPIGWTSGIGMKD